MPLIYFVEDDKAIGYVIEKTIQHAGLEGQGFQSGEAFMQAFIKEKPDLVLLDLMLPDTSGMNILKWIRKQDQITPVMIISALQSEMDKVIALDYGADDYMTKPFGVLELTSRIHSKLRKLSDERNYSLKNLVLDDKKHMLTVGDNVVYLTNKEYAILKLLLKNQKHVVTKETIFKDVWKTDFIGETRTLDMHIKAVRMKLLENKADAKIVTIRGIGYQIE